MMRRPDVLLILLAMLAFGVVVTLLWTWKSFDAASKPVTDPLQYASVMAGLRATNDSSILHFPPTIPANATAIEFFYQPKMLQGAFQLCLRCKVSSEQIAELSKLTSAKPTTSPSEIEHPHIVSIPPTFQKTVLGMREEPLTTNHGQNYGIAIDPTASEVIYWCEQW